MMSADSGTATETCVPTINPHTFDLGCLAPAIVIILVLAFQRRRLHKWPQHCHGRPGLVIPVNFLRGSHNRYAVAVAFGTTASQIFKLLVQHDGVLKWDVPPWSKAFITIIGVLVYGIVYYPLLACLTTEQRMTGSLMGFLYSTIRFSIGLVLDFQCNEISAGVLSKAYDYIDILTDLPVHLCMLFLVLKFAYLLFREVQNKWFRPVTLDLCAINTGVHGGSRSADDIELFAEEAEILNHVRDLINQKNLRQPERSGWFIKLRNKIYKPQPAFKFSTQVLSTLFVVFILLYEVTILGNMLVSVFRYRMERSTIRDMILGSGYIAVNLAWVIMVVIILDFMKAHRHNMMMMWHSSKDVFPGMMISPARLVGASLRYSGYQVAYMFFGNLTYASFLFVTAFILSFLIKIVEIIGEKFTKQAVGYIVGTLPLIGMALIVWLVRLILARFVFKDNEFPDRQITINNRRLYCVVSFFFFFLDVLMGAISCLMLMLKGTVLGILFLPRLDRCSLMQGFQIFDQGYMSYIGLVHVLAAHRHPVLLVFCHLLADKNTGGRTLLPVVQLPPARRSQQALNRWFLALTLMRNPHLIMHRRQSLDPRPLYFTGAPDWNSKELLVA